MELLAVTDDLYLLVHGCLPAPVVELRLSALSLNLICFFCQCLSSIGSFSVAGIVLLTTNKYFYLSCSFPFSLSLHLHPCCYSEVVLMLLAQLCTCDSYQHTTFPCRSVKAFPGTSHWLQWWRGSLVCAGGAGEGALPLWTPAVPCLSLASIISVCLNCLIAVCIPSAPAMWPISFALQIVIALPINSGSSSTLS